ncbi:MAG: class I SAM-dependent methyltransferase [Armatimonadota bacterium]|nr:class I SAM-dependent methyltransferase [Armatimonadota bacterium]
MRREIVDLLRCPASGSRLKVEVRETQGEAIVSGFLVAEDTGWRYPIVAGVPRFVPPEHYAETFGFQWRTFARTQLDSVSGQPISAGRFWRATAWRPEELRDQWVLDVGCGAGRFAEVALRAGARVVAVDASTAVDACYANLQGAGPISVIQADLYALPFRGGTFAFVYCLGVLQHTPDPPKAFAAIADMVAPGGRLCVDVYERSWKTWVHPKFWMRPVTTRMDRARLFRLLVKSVPRLRRLSSRLGRVPLAGRALQRLVPVANYEGIYPLRPDQLDEWALLDTFDWLSPVHDHPQTATALSTWFQEAGFRDIEIARAGHLVGRGRRPT